MPPQQKAAQLAAQLAVEHLVVEHLVVAHLFVAHLVVAQLFAQLKILNLHDLLPALLWTRLAARQQLTGSERISVSLLALSRLSVQPAAQESAGLFAQATRARGTQDSLQAPLPLVAYLFPQLPALLVGSHGELLIHQLRALAQPHR